MHFPHHPPHIDDDPPTMPVNVAEFVPPQRTSTESQIFDEATTEVPVITPFQSPSASDDSAVEEDAGEEADGSPAERPEEDSADAAASSQAAAHAPWADLAAPAPPETSTAEPAPAAEAARPEAEAPPGPEADRTLPDEAAAQENPLDEAAAAETEAEIELDEATPDDNAEGGETTTEEVATDPGAQTETAGTGPAATADEGTTVQATLDETEAPTATSGRPDGVTDAPITVWSEAEAQRLRTEWRELQIQFIDDPATAVAGAKRLVTEAVEQLSQALLSQRDQLDPATEQPDTEALRVAMRRHREFLDRVLAL